MSTTADYDRCTTCVVASAAVAVDVAAVVAADSFVDPAARFGIVCPMQICFHLLFYIKTFREPRGSLKLVNEASHNLTKRLSINAIKSFRDSGHFDQNNESFDGQSQ